jgi:hypothetical protein
MVVVWIILLPILTLGQTTVKVKSDLPPQEGNLNMAVQAAITAGTLSNTIFELEAYGYYVLTGTISVPAGMTLRITAPDPGTTQTTAPPQIVWSATGGVNTNFNFEVFGNISLKNVWLRYANTTGAQVGSSLQIQDDPLATAQLGTFENVIFDYAPCPPNASGAVGITTKRFKGVFKNCYFKNCIDHHLRYYGRALSFPFNTEGWHTLSVLFENCTFANIGYVYMQEGGQYSDNVRFNHCTFLNVVMFPLQSGWWYKAAVTNSIFVNCFMFGLNPSQLGTGDPNGATMRIDSVKNFGFTVPFTEEDRRILFANNSYFIDPWLVDWMANNPYSQKLRRERRDDEIPIQQPMLSPATLVFFEGKDQAGKKLFPYMNKTNIHENANPGFVLPPYAEADVKDFLRRKWDDNSQHNWAWKTNNDFIGLWPLEESLAYSNPTLKTAGMGGFPLGDLRWWPTEFAQWKTQAQAEYDKITDMMEKGLTSVQDISGTEIPTDYVLSQNYPNPFNPTTKIEYSIPNAGYVSLKIFNTLGQEVSTLFEGFQNAGKYIADFDGSKLASGVYLYKLQSNGISITKKLVLMK